MAPADAGAGLAKTRRRQTRGLGEKTCPQADPRVHFCTRTRGFRVSAVVATDIIKMHNPSIYTIKQHISIRNKGKLTINP